MVQDTQQQDGAVDDGQNSTAKLHLPTGEVLELPMLVVRLVFLTYLTDTRDPSLFATSLFL
jgi:hypothetical protein